MPNDNDPRRDFASRPAAPAVPDPDTYRFGGPKAAKPAKADEPALATVLDPGSWPSEAPPEPVAPELAFLPEPVGESAAPEPVHQPVAPSGPRRFGPGVPVPDTSAGTAQTAAVWHGTVRPGEPVVPLGRGRRRGRALGGWLLALLVLLGVLAYLYWQHLPSSANVVGATVRNGTAVQGCHSTARVVGTLRTSGGAGTVHYRWHRSDGTVSDELTQHVAKGDRSTDVVLLWSFDGPGTVSATATLEVLGAHPRSASTTFSYRCT